MNVTKILTLAGLVGTALMGGVFFAFGTAVMGSLQRMPAGQGAAAMNLINVRIQNPLFLLIFLGTALVCVALGIIALVKDTPGKWWLIGGAALYLVGVIVLSFAVNIPLNDKLAAIDPKSSAGAAEWANYLSAWNPANNIRAFACVLGVIAFGLALAAGTSTPKSTGAPQSVRAAGAPQYGPNQQPNHGLSQQPSQSQSQQPGQVPNPGWQPPQQLQNRQANVGIGG
jgi:uncharacterized membrane protein